MIKIIQIVSDAEGNIHGLDDAGKLYIWSRKCKPIPRDEDGNTIEYIFGWVLMKDEINVCQ